MHGGDLRMLPIVSGCGWKSGFYSADSPIVAELVSDSDDNLFQKVLNNQNHVLHKLVYFQNNQLMTIT